MEFYDLPNDIKDYVYELAENDSLPLVDNENYYVTIFINEIERFMNEDCEDEFVDDYLHCIDLAKSFIRQNKIDKILS